MALQLVSHRLIAARRNSHIYNLQFVNTCGGAWLRYQTWWPLKTSKSLTYLFVWSTQKYRTHDSFWTGQATRWIHLCCCCWKSRMKESNLALGSLATRHVGLSGLRAMGLLLHLDRGLSAYLEPQAQRHEPVWTKTTNNSTNINVNILVQMQIQIQNKRSGYILTRACQHISSPKLKDMSLSGPKLQIQAQT